MFQHEGRKTNTPTGFHEALLLRHTESESILTFQPGSLSDFMRIFRCVNAAALWDWRGM
jgi:hypothetical protein